MAYIFDLESTLSDASWRAHLLPDYDAFHAEMEKDEPLKNNIRLLKMCAGQDDVIILTGAMEKHRAQVERWLRRMYIDHLISQLIMRDNNDFRSSPHFKVDVLNRLEEKMKIHMLFDDREDVVEYAINSGFPAIQVVG